MEVDQGNENIGTLSVGERLEFSEFSTPAVLTRNGRVIKSTVPGIPAVDLEAALQGCRRQSECEIRLAGQTYLSLPIESIYFDDGISAAQSCRTWIRRQVRSSRFSEMFLLLPDSAHLLAALVLSAVSSRSIVQPIGAVIAKLREGARTSVLPEFSTTVTAIQEIRELMDSFNRAAAVIHDGEENLHRAYVEFVESLANALDARGWLHRRS